MVSALFGQEGGGEAAFPADFVYMDVCVEDAEDQARSDSHWQTTHLTTHHTHADPNKPNVFINLKYLKF